MPTLWVIISSSVSQGNIISIDDQHISIDFLLQHLFTMVYAYVIYHMRRLFWNVLSNDCNV